MTPITPIAGRSVKRVEDARFLVGKGDYLPNRHVEGELHLAVVRSPIAHGRILSIDTAEAIRAPGVAAVYVAADFDLAPIPCKVESISTDYARPVIAGDEVKFAGEIVAVVAASSPEAAADAADLVWADIEPLPAVADIAAAIEPNAPLVFPDLGSNIIYRSERDAKPDLFAGADVVVQASLRNQRVAALPLETNGAFAVPNGSAVDLLLGSQNVFAHRKEIAASLGMEEENLRARVPDMGGAFGGKYSTYPEHVLVVAAARKLGRPVRWIEERRDNLSGMYHGRDQLQKVEIGATNDGEIVGLKVTVYQNAGAYPAYAVDTAGSTMRMSCGAYRIPQADVEFAVVATHTTPVDAYRGAGRPEATALIERSIDLLAGELKMDPVELRRRNLIRSDEFPYRSATDVYYDTGDYAVALDRALEMVDYEGLRAEQKARRDAGNQRQLGIGLSTYVEPTSWGYDSEWSSIEVNPAGEVLAKVGTSNHGQGHDTAYTQLVADALKVPHEAVRILQGDTGVIARGTGTVASRSLQVAGSALIGSAEAVVDSAKSLVADRYEAAIEDVVLSDDGRFSVAGVPGTAMTWNEVATLAVEKAPPGSAAPQRLYAEHVFQNEGGPAAFGTHISVVEIDTETGATEVLRHVAVDDCGRILNPMLVMGQVHGGVAQGYGQALLEHVIHDEDANLLTGTLVSYLIPTAEMLPDFELDHTETPTPFNPLGAKGVGEAGSIGATPAVQNAVIDALSTLGVHHLDMPATPGRIWHAIQDASSGPTT